MGILKILQRTLYGKVAYYPANYIEELKVLTERKATLTLEQIEALKSMGIEVEFSDKKMNSLNDELIDTIKAYSLAHKGCSIEELALVFHLTRKEATRAFNSVLEDKEKIE